MSRPPISIEQGKEQGEGFAVKAATSRELAKKGPDLPAPVDKNQALARIEEMEGQLFEQSSTILTSALDAFELEDGEFQAEPPTEWIELYGEKGAKKRFRAAKAALLNSASAPVALKIASQLVTTMTKAKADKQEAPNLNVVINLPPSVATSPDDLPIIVLNPDD